MYKDETFGNIQRIIISYFQFFSPNKLFCIFYNEMCKSVYICYDNNGVILFLLNTGGFSTVYNK